MSEEYKYAQLCIKNWELVYQAFVVIITARVIAKINKIARYVITIMQLVEVSLLFLQWMGVFMIIKGRELIISMCCDLF